MLNHKYLKLLSKDFPNEHMATGEIIRLEGLCEMPKGTGFLVIYTAKMVHLFISCVLHREIFAQRLENFMATSYRR